MSTTPKPNLKLKSRPKSYAIKPDTNTSILSFFKREPVEVDLFIASRNGVLPIPIDDVDDDADDVYESISTSTSIKRRKLSGGCGNGEFRPKPQQDDISTARESNPQNVNIPFLDASDSDAEDELQVKNEVFMDGDFEEFQGLDDFEDIQGEEEREGNEWPQLEQVMSDSCPICNLSLEGSTQIQISIHVNHCLDGAESTSLDQQLVAPKPDPAVHDASTSANKKSSLSPSSSSAFSKLMSTNADDTAWANAAASERASYRKPAYLRACPFYKIMPNMGITVDAFRFGAVDGCQAYFLSHFHNDHYIGLTPKWAHGYIYCSHVTARLVVQQLKVDPKWVRGLDFEAETELGINHVNVTLIEANHCPGSALFLFEQQGPKKMRILHTGDFRACREHVLHPKIHQTKIDICYLDTTYLNPKYAFPPQKMVIETCADLCKQINKEKKRLLIVVGTYSIGKERICIAIAKALDSKIYASTSKMRILNALHNVDLEGRLTTDASQAQVHMTSLFELRPDTLADYLATHRESFSDVVGFRPTGWTYRPPATRLSNPPVKDILHGPSWKPKLSIKDLSPQRGSTGKVSCYGVPYSEHSSFRELCGFVCGLNIAKVIPTVNVGNQTSRERMKYWVTKWEEHRKKTGLKEDYF